MSNERSDAVYAGVELGGTKVILGAGRADGTLLRRERIPTGRPDDTLPRIHEILESFADGLGPPGGLGVATFGPIQLDRSHEEYGLIGPTPKLAWRGVNLATEFGARFDGPLDVQTDVIGAAIGEATWGAGRDRDPFVYITVGTGIGGGVIVGGRPVTGLRHPELGHMRSPRAPGDDYPGGCAVHVDCLEGLGAGPSIVARWGAQLDELPEDHEAYEVIAHYLGHLVTDVILCVSPRRIVLGGGVMSNRRLFPRIHANVRRFLNDFLAVEALEDRIDETIVPPGLDADAGVLGAIAMAIRRAGEEAGR